MMCMFDMQCPSRSCIHLLNATKKLTGEGARREEKGELALLFRSHFGVENCQSTEGILRWSSWINR
jgi:hypothetical protein